MTTTNDTGLLANLRALTAESSPSLTDLFDASERQARLLRELLAATADPLLSRLTDLIPTLCIDTLDAMPVGGTSFWGNGRWHIHLRQGDPTDFHRFTALHQLKHIIDYPLRQKMTMVKNTDWEATADYFATSVLRPPKQAGEYIEYTTREEDAYEPTR